MKQIHFLLVTAVSLCRAESPKTRVAHIGLEMDGGWSFMKQVQEEPGAELVAVADSHPELVERARGVTAPGTRYYGDFERMLDEVKPAAVTAALPNNEHLAVLRACARRRIHVWFQKPMATTANDAREMERLSREAGIILMINYHPLWTASMQAITSRIEAGEIGTVERLVMRHAFNASKVLSPYYKSYFLEPARHGGGALMDQGTYGIDYAVFLFGRPQRVFASAKNLHDVKGLRNEDEAWAVLDYPKATAIINGAWWSLPDTGPGMGELTVTGSKGMLQRATVEGALPIPPERKHGIAHFIDCVRNNRPVDAPHSAAVNVIVNEVVDAAYESIRTGQAITLPR